MDSGSDLLFCLHIFILTKQFVFTYFSKVNLTNNTITIALYLSNVWWLWLAPKATFHPYVYQLWCTLIWHVTWYILYVTHVQLPCIIETLTFNHIMCIQYVITFRNNIFPYLLLFTFGKDNTIYRNITDFCSSHASL